MSRKFILPLIVVFALGAAAPWSADAQPVNRWRDFQLAADRPSDYMKNNEQIKNLLKPVMASAAAATVRVFSDGRAVALGTVVSADGLVLTKASQLGEKIECRLADAHTLPATLVGMDEATDLALLRINAKNLTPVVWADPPTPGSIVAATGPGSGPTQIGAVSDVQQPMPGPGRGVERGGWLGIYVGSVDDGAEIQRIMPGSAAAKAGLKSGDHITKLDGESLHNSNELLDKLRQMPPNRNVSLSVSRKDEKLEMKITLGRNPSPAPQDNWGGGPFSERRYGFSSVIPNDLGIAPTECGGPLVDIDGRCVGINIARALRVATYALPASVAKQTIEKLQAGKK